MDDKKVVLVLASALMLLASMSIPVKGQRGARSDLDIYFYTDDTAAYAALLAGEIDLYAGMLTYEQCMDAIERPEIIVTPKVTTFTITNWAYMSAGYDEATGHHEHFGLQPETKPWVGIKNPISDPYMRKALACCVDAARYLAEVYKGFGVELDVPVTFNAQDPWANATLCDHLGGKYPWSYNLAKAKELLTAGGWVDVDGDGIVNFPPDWPGAPGRPNINFKAGLAFFCYDHPEERRLTAESFRAEFEKVLGPGTINGPLIRSYDWFDEYIWTYYDYHIASDGWTVGRFPTYLYSFFHSDNWWPGYGGLNAYTPGEADMDEAIAKFYYPPDMETAVSAAHEAQYYIADKYCIWLTAGHSGQGAYGYRNLVGVVSTPFTAPWNIYTQMQAVRVDDPAKPVRVGLSIIPPNLNQLTAMWGASYTSLGPAWDFFLAMSPYMPARQDADMPLRFRDWHDPPLTWVDPVDGKEKTVSKHYLDHRYRWVHPINGSVYYNFTTYDLEFNAWYFYQTRAPSAWWRASYAYIDHIRPLGPYEIEVYFTRKSYWWYLYPHTYNTICARAWLREPLIVDGDPVTPGMQPTVAKFVEGINITTPGTVALPFRARNAPVDVLSVVGDGITLTEYKDFEIVKGRVQIYHDFPDGTAITITYWGRGHYVGATVADIPLTEIHYGTGPYYLIAYDPLTGVSYKRNPNHPLATPPWGEVDWWWRWEVGYQKKRLQSGYMKIDIYDLVKISGAYGATATLTPSPNWDTSADMAAPPGTPRGVINIYDIVTATGKYGLTFWHLPPP